MPLTYVSGCDKSVGWVSRVGEAIERYTLEPKGASWTATKDAAVQGGAGFRPVDMSIAPNGSLYFTD